MGASLLEHRIRNNLRANVPFTGFLSFHVNQDQPAPFITFFSYNLINNLFYSSKKQQMKKKNPILITYFRTIFSYTLNILNIVHVPDVSHCAVFEECKFQRHVSVVLCCDSENNNSPNCFHN